MKTVNSISGGRTSAYISANYPADLDVFALVCVDDHNCGGYFKKDKKLTQQVNDRLQKYCSHFPEFMATTEDPIIVKTIFQLEQFTGREIIWVRGMSWEQMLKYQQAIPNMAKRFCTKILKLWPIFEHIYIHHDIPVKMRIGYRYDEMERKEQFTDTIKYPVRCQYYPKSNRWVQRWEDFKWRVGEFPLIDDKVHHFKVKRYWHNKPVSFAEDSNCQNCFWKQPQQLRKNFENSKAIMYWAAITEQMMNRTFRDDYSLLQISKLSIQQDFQFGTGSGCQAGGCTD
jgi:hypothetical protein